MLIIRYQLPGSSSHPKFQHSLSYTSPLSCTWCLNVCPYTYVHVQTYCTYLPHAIVWLYIFYIFTFPNGRDVRNVKTAIYIMHHHIRHSSKHWDREIMKRSRYLSFSFPTLHKGNGKRNLNWNISRFFRLNEILFSLLFCYSRLINFLGFFRSLEKCNKFSFHSFNFQCDRTWG